VTVDHRSSAVADEQDNSAEALSGPRELLLAQVDAVVRDSSSGTASWLARDAAARSWGCVSLAITRIVR